MGQRSISEIMEEGQRLTLEHSELLRKSIVSTLTAEESARKGVLEGYLLGLMGEAQAQGVGVGVGTGYGQVQETEGNDVFADDPDGFNPDVFNETDEADLGLEDAPENYRGGYGFGY